MKEESMGHFTTEERDNGQHKIHVMKLNMKKVIGDDLIDRLGEELFAKQQEMQPGDRLVVDFKEVEYYSSAGLGKLIKLDKQLKAAQEGGLHLCSMHPDVYETFVITRLNKLFDIKDNVEVSAAAITGGKAVG